MELQKAWPELDAAGVAVFGLSYDAVDVLAAFAQKRGINFTLLSDVGSHGIRELGLLNEHVAEQHAFYGVAVRDEHYGVPYPGTFVLDENGVVTAKYFEQSYRVRPTAALFLQFALGSAGEHPPSQTVTDADLKIQAWTDAPTYRPYHQVRLHVRVDMPPGTHVLAAPVTEWYTPLQVEIEPMDELTVDAMQASAGHPFRVPGLDEDLLVHTGTVHVTLPLLLTKNLGPTELDVRITYQSCTDTVCYPPRTVGLHLALEGLDSIRD